MTPAITPALYVKRGVLCDKVPFRGFLPEHKNQSSIRDFEAENGYSPATTRDSRPERRYML